MLYRIITRISIQTSGLVFGSTGLCSYRVRGVKLMAVVHYGEKLGVTVDPQQNGKNISGGLA